MIPHDALHVTLWGSGASSPSSNVDQGAAAATRQTGHPSRCRRRGRIRSPRRFSGSLVDAAASEPGARSASSMCRRARDAGIVRTRASGSGSSGMQSAAPAYRPLSRFRGRCETSAWSGAWPSAAIGVCRGDAGQHVFRGTFARRSSRARIESVKGSTWAWFPKMRGRRRDRSGRFHNGRMPRSLSTRRSSPGGKS